MRCSKEEQNIFEELQNNEELYNTFVSIARYTTTNDERGMLKIFSVKLEECFNVVKNNGINKENSVIKNYIERLITYKLVKYEVNVEDHEDEEELKIILTDTSTGISGFKIYLRIKSNEEMEKNEKYQMEETSRLFEEITQPYKSKLEEVEQKIDDGIIKNVQVISIFAGVIALLFTNIIGIKELGQNGIKGLMFINASMIMAIFALIVFTRQLIVKRDFTVKSLGICIITIFLTFLPIVALWIIQHN